MLSFWKTLRRWYSTVRRLMNSWAAMSGLLAPRLTKVGDLQLLGGQLLDSVEVPRAGGFAAGSQLGAGTGGPWSDAEVGERLQCRTQVPASLSPPPGTAEVLAITEFYPRAPEWHWNGQQPQRLLEVGIGLIDSVAATPGGGKAPSQRTAVRRNGELTGGGVLSSCAELGATRSATSRWSDRTAASTR